MYAEFRCTDLLHLFVVRRSASLSVACSNFNRRLNFENVCYILHIRYYIFYVTFSTYQIYYTSFRARRRFFGSHEGEGRVRQAGGGVGMGGWGKIVDGCYSICLCRLYYLVKTRVCMCIYMYIYTCMYVHVCIYTATVLVCVHVTVYPKTDLASTLFRHIT